ncbi:MAG: redoxin domain-containing protein [Bacteroidota bacterium]
MRALLGLLAVFLALPVSAQVPVRFEVEVPGTLAPLDTVFLAGSFNGWNPGDGWGDGEMTGRHPMTRVGPNRFAVTVDAPAGDMLLYKYTLGSWSFVERDAVDEEIPNRHVVASLADGQTAVAVRDTVVRWALLDAAIREGGWLPDHLVILQNRVLAPKLFAYFEEHGGPDSTWTPADIDDHVAMMEAWWADATGDQADRELGSSILRYFVMGLPSDAARTHWAETHAMPAVLAEWAYYRQATPTVERWYAVQSLLNYLLDIAPAFPLDEALTREVHAAVLTVPEVLTTYEAADLPDAERIALTSAASVLEGYLRLWNLRLALLDERFADATALLTEALSTAVRGLPLTLGFELAERQAERDLEAGFATFDLIARETNAYVLDNATLREAYAKLDPEMGAVRFEAIVPERPLIANLPEAQAQPSLDGVYLDLQTDQLVDLALLRGSTVLLDFWTTWCGPCIAEMPALNELHADLVGQPGVVFLSVNADAVTTGGDDEAARTMAENAALAYPILFDEAETSLVARFGVRGYPTKLLVEPDGTVRELGMGGGVESIRALLAERGFLAP